MIETPPLVDQYCHGVLRTELGLGTFEAQLGANGGPPAPGTTFFDTWAGFAVRRWCPPLLGLEPHCPPAHYLARRRELGVLQAGRRLLRGSGIGAFLVDTGQAGDLTGPGEMAADSDAEAHEIVRLELLADQVAATSGTVESFLANLAESVHAAAAHAVAFSSRTGVRHALAVGPEPPDAAEVHRAAARRLAARAGSGRTAGGGADPVLVRHLLWIAVGTGRPLQLLLDGAEPGARAAAFARETAGLGTDLVLLPRGPQDAPAVALTAEFPHVHADLGRALARTGARAEPFLAELLDLAPFGKLLYSSGARALPELHVVAARSFTVALGRLLEGLVADGAWAASDADRVARLLSAENARRVYGLGE